MCGGGSDGSEEMLAYQKEQDRKQRRRREEGMENVRAFFDGGHDSDGEFHRGFDDDFHEQRADAYEEFANPQIDNQFQDARLALMEGLSSANLHGSTAQQFGADQLQRDLDQGRDQVARQGQAQVQNSKQQVQNQRQQMTSLVQSGADPGQLPLESAANALDFADSFDPIGNVFQGTTQLAAGAVRGKGRDAAVRRGNAAYGTNPNSGSGKSF